MHNKYKIVKDNIVQNVIVCQDPSGFPLREGESLVQCEHIKVKIGENFKKPDSQPVTVIDIPNPGAINIRTEPIPKWIYIAGSILAIAASAAIYFINKGV